MMRFCENGVQHELTSKAFDDFLGLAGTRFSDTRLIIFCGISGSGKSRSLEFLAHGHQDLKERRQVWLHPGDGPVERFEIRDSLVMVDEIRYESQLAGLGTLLRLGNTLCVASHVHPWRYWRLRAKWRSKCYQTDKSSDKISRYLDDIEIPYSSEAVNQYCRIFGASYLDARHILERSPGESFDIALQRFLKFCQMQKDPRFE